MPSFAIEVPGEANPLSRQTVLSILADASGGVTNHQSLQVAFKQIQNWETLPGYYVLLQNIYADFSLTQEVRFQAIIQLKNGIDKHWRKTATNSISKDEKQRIRATAIDAGVREPVPALALQNALMLGKIVRYEFPHDWPDVIGIIIKQLRIASENLDNSRSVSNILVIALQIIKELASGRLQRTKRSLQSVSSELLQVLGGLYIKLVTLWTTSPGSLDAQVAKNSHSALKTLRRLLVVGFEHPHRDDHVKDFWTVLQEHAQWFWQKQSNTADQLLAEVCIKHLLQLSKLYLDTARTHPASFVMLNPNPILNRSWAMISANDAKVPLSSKQDWDVYRNGDDTEDNPLEKLSLKALLLFRACVKMVFNPAQTFKYQTPQDKEDKKVAMEQIKSQVLTDDFVLQFMEILVTQYFVLRPSDLRDWEQEPDEWERREEEIADAWEFSIRSCSEKLFLDLVINFKELLVPRLLQVFEQYATISNTNVLLKDSLYAAIGIASACIEDIFDFNTFLRNTLVPEVQMQQSNYNLLRRRTAIVLAQWVPIKPEGIDRVAVYQIFTHLLSSDDKLNDHVVRVTAGRQLRLVLEPFEFKYEDFAPYATQLLSSIMLLTTETELSETKMALLETARVAVTKLQGHIEPYASGIMSMLPPLWQQSGEEHLMKQAILTMITAIITSLGQKSVAYHGAILPLVHDSIQPESEAIVYLLEEALDLWATILEHTPSTDTAPSNDLLSMTQDLLPLLEMGSDHLRQVFELIESYTALSPHTILESSFLNPLLVSMKNLLSMLSSSRARDASLAPHVLENLVSTLSIADYFSVEASQHALQHLFNAMIETGYFSELLRIIREAYEYHQDPRLNRKPPDIIGPGETSLFSLLSRFALISPSLFMQAVATTSNPPSADWLVIEWISHFDSIGDILRKKLQTLAITNLLIASTPPPQIMLEQLQSLLTVWTDVVTELSDADEVDPDAIDNTACDDTNGVGSPSSTLPNLPSSQPLRPYRPTGDYLHHTQTGTSVSDLPEWPDASAQDARKKMIHNNDPIYTLNIREFIADRLGQTMKNWPGGQSAFENEWLGNGRVDEVVLKGFINLGVL